MENWLDDLVAQCKEFETPQRYFWWSGIAAVSALVGKQFFLNRYSYKLYPNVYVALVSSDSGMRKGPAVSLCKKLLKPFEEVLVISGQNSIQSVTHELSQARTVKGNIYEKAQGILISPEFHVFFTKDETALTILVDLHNTHEWDEKWVKKLKGSPEEVLKEPCLTLLVGSNEVLFDASLCKKDTEGGFIARTFIIYEDTLHTFNSLAYKPSILPDFAPALKQMHRIQKLKGEFQWTEQAQLFYDTWYQHLRKTSTRKDRTGTINRLGDQILKLAMIMQVLESDELILTEEIIARAIVKAEQNLAGVRRLSTGDSSGNQEQDVAIPRIMKLILAAQDRILSRKAILAKTGLDNMVCSRALQTLIEGEFLKMVATTEGNRTMYFYQMTPEKYKEYIAFKEEN